MRMRKNVVRIYVLMALMTVALWSPLFPSAGQRIAAQENLRVLLEDNFVGNTTGWKAPTPDTELAVSGGALTLETTAAGKASWATPAATFPDDIDVEVEARVVNPPSEGDWNVALLLRASTRDMNTTLYHFGLSGSGYYEFSARPPDATQYVNSIKTGKIDVNFSRAVKLKVSARGDTFIFFVNGRLVGTFTDSSIDSDPDSEKYIGLMGGTYSDTPRLKVEFRKLIISEPTPAGSNAGVNDPEVLLSDNFSDNSNDWGLADTDNSKVTVENGALNIEVKKENVLSWTQSSKRFPEDVNVSVNILNTSPDDVGDWSYGIGVRGYKKDSDSYFYLFEVRGTGVFTLTTQRGGSVIKTLIPTRTLNDFDPAAEHVMRLVAKGDTFTLYFDGLQIGQTKDSSLDKQTEYSVLLSAGTFEGSETIQARFTQFLVRVAD